MLKHPYSIDKKNRLHSKALPDYDASYPGIIQQQYFQVQTFEEARKLAHNLSKKFPHPNQAELGLNELLMNAIEHGNLNISFEEKHKILQNNDWMNTVYERLFMQENKKKKVFIMFEKTASCVSIHIQDQGDGFNWQHYLGKAPNAQINGHGIFLAKNYAFDCLEYYGNGNYVVGRAYFPYPG